MSPIRERDVSRMFVTLADTLVRDFDALDFLTTLCEACVDLLDVSAAGVILIDQRGGLEVAAASSERSRLLEVFAVAIDAGPCVDCIHSGIPVVSSDLAADSAAGKWVRFAAGASAAGFSAAHAIPMRWNGQVVGVVNLLHTERRDLGEDDAALAQAFADTATIGLLQQRALNRAQTLTEQLQGALNSRVVIEQAKGMLAREGATTPDLAYTVLRDHARRHGLHLTELARQVVAGTLDMAMLTPPASSS